jgi:hypothetical protein
MVRTPAKKRSKPAAEARALVKLEGVARATFEHKKSVTEVIPPDVTRAKAGRWLDLISPITEWAGLRGDQLRHRRSMLRVQQEEALVNLAEIVRRRSVGQMISHPLPPKVLVPALEAASLEDPQSPLIAWWAELLISGAVHGAPRPFHIDLMKAIGPEEALFLDRLWTVFSPHLELFPDSATILAVLPMQIKFYADKVVARETQFDGEEWVAETVRLLQADSPSSISHAESFGVGARIDFSMGSKRFGMASGLFRSGGIPLDVCRALNLVKESTVPCNFENLGLIGGKLDISLVHLTDLGIEFLRFCHPNSQTNDTSRELAAEELFGLPSQMIGDGWVPMS